VPSCANVWTKPGRPSGLFAFVKRWSTPFAAISAPLRIPADLRRLGEPIDLPGLNENAPGCETIGAAVRIQPVYEAAVVRSQPSFDHSGSERSIMRVFRILTISSESDRFAAVVVYVLTIAHPIPRRITHDRAL
jgi:hypothetical protein